MKEGVLNIHKTPGMTSHDVVDEVRSLLKTRQVGHAGTLDPFAGGVLLIGFGRATKILRYLSGLPKEYRATLFLGEEKDTMDSEGTTVERLPVPDLEEKAISQAMAALIGHQQQKPPPYSALKVRGVPAHRLARKGVKVDLPARAIFVESLALIRWEEPLLEFSATVSKGTYLRKLASDLARRLGSCGHLVSLTRTAVGPHTLEDSLALEDLGKRADDRLEAVSLSPADALSHLPKIILGAEEAAAIMNGRLPPEKQLTGFLPEQGIAIAAVDQDGRLIAVLRRAKAPPPGPEEGGPLKIERVFPR